MSQLQYTLPQSISDRGGRPFALILDDHTLFAESFASLLEKTNVFRAVYSFVDEEPILAFLMKQEERVPIYLFLDFYLKEKNCLPIINDLKRIYKPLHLIIISSVTNPILIKEILSYKKIDGFLSKYSEATEIATCLQYIKNKQLFVSPSITCLMESNTDEAKRPFSVREIEILNFLAQGLSVDDTAKSIQLSRHTIIAHKRNMMTKSNTTTITGLLAYARKIDLI